MRPIITSESPVDDPPGADAGRVPGGPRRELDSSSRFARSAFRIRDVPEYRGSYLGFRVALEESGR